jgi:hypothetical protein
MTQQMQQIEGAWTDAETTAFVEALDAFRESLPTRQRDILAAVLTASAHAVADDMPAQDDARGFLFYASLFSALDRLAKSLSGVPAWPEGTTVYYPDR